MKSNLCRKVFKKMFKFFYIKFLVLILLFGFASNSYSLLPKSFAPVVEKTAEGVVNISTTKTVSGNRSGNEMFNFFFGDQNRSVPNQGAAPREFKTSALGSGFLIDKMGYIVTNNHVIDGADEIIVKTTTQKEFKAVVIGADPLTDLALLKIELNGEMIEPLVLGDINQAKIGDWVIAIGNPLGLGGTVTAGIISAKGRVIGDGPYDNFIQTDASINPGNSGGPLLNTDGEVIGVNTAIIQSAQGLGFAIPVDMLIKILPKLRQGKVSRGWLGVTLQELDEDIAKSLDKNDSNGVLVADVMIDHPADRYGIKAGDIIVGIDGLPVTNARELTKLIGDTSPDDTITVRVFRNGKVGNIDVKLGERPTSNQEIVTNKVPTGNLAVRDMSSQERERYGINEGVVVTSIREDSSAFKSGLRSGDIIVWFNKRSINKKSDFDTFYKNIKKDNVIGLKIISQNGGVRFIAFNKE